MHFQSNDFGYFVLRQAIRCNAYCYVVGFIIVGKAKIKAV